MSESQTLQFRCSLQQTVNVIAMFSILVYCISNTYSLMLTNREGDFVELKFPYSCDSSKVSLQLGLWDPFYSSSNAKSKTLPPNQRLTDENKTEDCSIKLVFDPVKRTDAGTYTSKVYTDDLDKPEETQIGLHVDFPPGPVSCTLGERQEGDWRALDCIASVGSLSGQIQCYQEGSTMPSKTSSHETMRSLKQTLLIRNSRPAFCCSSIADEPKERCECKDWAIFSDRITDSDILEPCPFNTSDSAHSPPFTQSVSENNTMNATKSPSTMKNSWTTSPLLKTMSTLILVTKVRQVRMPVIYWIVLVIVTCFLLCVVFNARKTLKYHRVFLAKKDEGHCLDGPV